MTLGTSINGMLCDLGVNQGPHFCHDLIMRDAWVIVIQSCLNLNAKPAVVAVDLLLAICGEI